ncbi:MAG: dienelactone hydrolase family protein [Caldilineaceae bacterium]|nr:dienelactone hydrolase family protein [Caldilineaceae bacterium]
MTHAPLADPHRGRPILQAGQPLGSAPVVMIMLHGRGAGASSILALAVEFNRPDLTYLAPQAAGNSWYPYSFLAPLAQNEPYLSSALSAVGATLKTVVEAGVPQAETVLLGFSQGACLALEFAARHGGRFGALVGLSGGLIGPADIPRGYATDLDGSATFIGCSDVDAHIPLARVHETAQALTQLGAAVTERIYPGMGHTVNADEIAAIRALLDDLHLSRSGGSMA